MTAIAGSASSIISNSVAVTMSAASAVSVTMSMAANASASMMMNVVMIDVSAVMNDVIVIVYVDVAMSVIVSADAVVMNIDNAFDIVNYVAFCTSNRFFITKRIARNVVDTRRLDNRSNRFNRFYVLNDCIGEKFLTVSHAFQIKTDYFRPVSIEEQCSGFFVPGIQRANDSAADVYNFEIVPWDVLCRRSHLQFDLKAGTVSRGFGCVC